MGGLFAVALFAACLNDAGSDRVVMAPATASVSGVGAIDADHQAQAQLNSDLVEALRNGPSTERNARATELLRAGADPTATVGATTPLHVAANKGDVATLRLLLDAGASLERRDRAGQTALMVAAGARSADKVRFLLDRGAEVDGARRKGTTAALRACEDHSIEVLEILVDAGADLWRTDLSGRGCVHAALDGELDTLRWAIARGAPFDRAADVNGVPMRPIAWAARRDRVDAVQILSDAGAPLSGPGGPCSTPPPQRQRRERSAGRWRKAPIRTNGTMIS